MSNKNLRKWYNTTWQKIVRDLNNLLVLYLITTCLKVFLLLVLMVLLSTAHGKPVPIISLGPFATGLIIGGGLAATGLLIGQLDNLG